METFWHILSRTLGLLGLAGLAYWILAGWWKKSDDRPGLLVRWLFTLADLLFLALVVGPLVVRFDYAAAFVGIPMAAVGGVVLATIWAPHLTESFGRKVGQLYDGGDIPADPEPFLSIAEARRKLGKYPEAVVEVQKQLERFPTHFRTLMLLAEIQADDQHDLPAASETVERLVNQPDHAPKNIAYALTRLADWQLKTTKDPALARQTFERIVALFPDSPEAHHAHQRIAHLASAEFLASGADRTPLKLVRHEAHLGLRPDFAGLKLPEPDVAARAAELVQQLERFPLDNQAREDLASVYANQFHRLDLATEQLEQLIAQPHAPEPQIVRWLNQLADLQVKEGGDLEAARQTVGRILERFPASPAADTAQRRLATLALEARGKKESQVVKLGSYEQRLGLRKGPPSFREHPPAD